MWKLSFTQTDSPSPAYLRNCRIPIENSTSFFSLLEKLSHTYSKQHKFLTDISPQENKSTAIGITLVNMFIEVMNIANSDNKQNQYKPRDTHIFTSSVTELLVKMECHNPVYEEVDDLKTYKVDLQKNDCYESVKKSSDGITIKSKNSVPDTKKSNKNIVVVLCLISAILVLLMLGAIATIVHTLNEISKLKSEIAITNQAVLQQDIAFSSMLENAQMNVSLEAMMHQQLVRDLEDRIQNFSTGLETALDARITEVHTFSNQQYFALQEMNNATAEMSASAIFTLHQQSAQNDSALDTRLASLANSSDTAHQQLNSSILAIAGFLGACDVLPSSLPAGYYYILSSNGSAVRQYCPSITTRCGQTGRWRSVANLDMTNSTHQCFNSDFRMHTYSNKTLCVRNSGNPGCSSVQLPTTTAYRSVCGQVRAYQFGRPEAFLPSVLIDSPYVDGVSITHGSPRQHIWTFAAASSETSQREGCPCMGGSDSRPAFVGDDYFCDTGTFNDTGIVFYGDDPLWDGAGCDGPTNNCCRFNTPPWFYKELAQYTHNDVEVRLCSDFFRYNEDIGIESIEIHVK